MMKKASDIGEIELINRFKKRFTASSHTKHGIGDDTAVIDVPGKKDLLLFTCDTVVSGVHFKANEKNWYGIGWKAMGAGLSDIAAMAGIPKSAVVSLAIPKSISLKKINDFTKGIKKLADCFGVDVVGGDTVCSPHSTVVSVSVVGTVSKKDLALRSGAKIGDKILTTGTLGGSRPKKQFSFMPRIKEARQLLKYARINSMMDITDGLIIDLYRLIKESKVGAVLYKENIPISKDALKEKDPLKRAFYDGEDFELLFTTPSPGKLLKKWCNKKVPLTVIGEITSKKNEIRLLYNNSKSKRVVPHGYEHFK